ncbi:MAG: O-antigen polymerase [Promethearchaeota archaeon]
MLIYFFRSLYLLSGFPSQFLGQKPFSKEIIGAWNLSLIYLIISFVIFLIGYYSKVGVAIANSLPKLPNEWGVGKAKIFLPLFVIIGFISYFILFKYIGGFFYYLTHKSEALTIPGTSYINFGVAFLNYSFLIGLIFALKFKKLRKTTFLFLLPIILTMGFIRGSKAALLGPILAAIIIFHYLKKPLKLKHIFLFLLFVILAIPILDVNRGAKNLSNISKAFLVYSNPIKPITIFMNRFHDMDSMIYIVRDTPGVMDYQLGKTIAPIFVSWIPRQLWENKPTIAFGRVFGETYYKEFFGGTGTVPSATIIGEAYINYHVAGMVGISLLFGILLRIFYQYLIKNNLGVSGVFIYSSNFLGLSIFWEADFSIVITALVFSLFLLFSISFLLSKTSRKFTNI